MEIYVYTLKECVKDKVLESLFREINLPYEVQSYYVDQPEVMDYCYYALGMDSFPSLLLSVSTKGLKFSNITLPLKLSSITSGLGPIGS